jgi:hypothetical protein
MAISTREDLKDYALRRLGFPVIEINVDDVQVEDRIDDALQFFSQYHFDGVEESYLPYVISAQDMANKYINTNNISPGSSGGEIISIVKVYTVAGGMQSGMFSVQYQMMLNDYFSGFFTGGGGLNYYDSTKQYLSMLQQFLSPDKQVSFSRVTNKLKIHTDWSEQFTTGSQLMVLAQVSLNPETYGEIYNDILLKRYVTALIKRQWSANLSKFSSIALPGGMKFDAATMYADSVVEIGEIESTVQSKYEYPPHFSVG